MDLIILKIFLVNLKIIFSVYIFNYYIYILLNIISSSFRQKIIASKYVEGNK